MTPTPTRSSLFKEQGEFSILCGYIERMYEEKYRKFSNFVTWERRSWNLKEVEGGYLYPLEETAAERSRCEEWKVGWNWRR
jgi:hypothetical protein